MTEPSSAKSTSRLLSIDFVLDTEASRSLMFT